MPPYQFLYVAIYLLPSSTVSVIETFDFSHPGGVVTEVFAMVVIAFLFGWPEFLTPCLSLIGLRSSYFRFAFYILNMFNLKSINF